MNKFSIYLALVLILCAISSCERESLLISCRDELCFALTLEDGPFQSKSLPDSIWLSSSEDLDILLESSAIPNMSGGAASKAAPYQCVPDSVALFAYRYYNWNDELPATLSSGTLLQRNSYGWTGEKGLLLDSRDSKCKMRFFSYAPYGADGLSAVNDKGGLSFVYSVPESVSAQTDLLFGISGEYKGDSRRVEMTYSHILSSITFSVSELCSNVILKSISLKGIYTSAQYSAQSLWRNHGERGTRSIRLDAQVNNGQASALTEGASTMMMLPQILPETASLELEVQLDDRIVLLETSIAGLEWRPGGNYCYKLSFDTEPYNSSITYEIDTSHKRLFGDMSTLSIPRMEFRSGTKKIKIDWGDGTEDVFTSSQERSAFMHTFPQNYKGKILVSIKGESPIILVDNNWVKGIRKIRLADNEYYDSRNDCNCIISKADSSLVYAGVEYSLPAELRTINAYAFINVQDTEIIVPEGIRRLKQYAFAGENCYNKSVYLPSSLSLIEDGAFMNYHLDYIRVDAANPVYDSRNNCNCIMETKSDYLVASSRNAVYPPEMKGIKDFGLGCSPSEVVLPDGCLDIGRYAGRSNLFLSRLVLPASCKIGEYAFSSTDIEEIDYSAGDITLDAYAFYNSRGIIDTLDLGKFKSIAPCAFKNNIGIKSLVIPEGYLLPEECFSACSSLQNVYIPKDCRLGTRAFSGSGLITLSLASSRKYNIYSTFIFANCMRLSEVFVYDGIDAFKKYDFFYCPIGRFYIYCTAPPPLFEFDLYKTDGEVHTRKAPGFYAWFTQSNFGKSDWKLIEDLN